MSGNKNLPGETVERVKISDDPHERYQFLAPFSGEELKRGIPILKGVPGGKVVRKDVTYSEVHCSECDIAAKYTSDSEPVCPECGLICTGKGVNLQPIVRDAKAAGRIEGESA